MSAPARDAKPDELQAMLPIFPLSGVLLLPRGRLPLNIFEPRYLAMFSDALGGARIVGMVQPHDDRDMGGNPPVYRTGCAGRIVSFSETEDGRYLVTLSGVQRFDIVEELPPVKGYRLVRVDWRRFASDLDPPSAGGIDRERLLAALKPYFQRHNISADWDAVTQTPDERLVTTLAMVCPFAASEKQALLEADGLGPRAATLTALLEMAGVPAAPARADLRH